MTITQQNYRPPDPRNVFDCCLISKSNKQIEQTNRTNKSNKRDMILIGALSREDEITGQSLCFDLLTENLGKSNFNYRIININFTNEPILKKTYYYFKALIILTKNLIFYPKIKFVYLTIAQGLSGFIRDYFFISISALFGKDIIVHLHGGNYKNFYLNQSPFVKRRIKKTLEKCSRIIILSNRFEPLFDFVDNYRDKIRVVKNGVICPINAPFQKSYNPKKPILLYLSNLIETKGYFDVLKSIKILKEEYDIDPTIYFCGSFMSNTDDYIFKNVKEAQLAFNLYIKENNLEKNVIFKGLVQGAVKEALLVNAGLMLLPSNYNSEGQPMSLIEGLAHSCVLITTQYRDIESINCNNHTGLYVPYKSPKAIAANIASINETNFQKMSKNSFTHYERNFSFEKHIQDIKKIFYEFIEK